MDKDRFDASIKFELGEIADHLKALVEHTRKTRSRVWLHVFGGMLAGAVGAIIVVGLEDYIHTQRHLLHVAPASLSAPLEVTPTAVVPERTFRGRSGR